MEKDWIVIYSSDKLYVAEMAKKMLKDNQIEAIIINKKDTSYPVIGDIELYVHRNNVMTAKKLIEDFKI